MGPEVTYTNSYSMDIIIKICATLFTFIIFLFLSAWHITRKKYKYPPLVENKYSIENIKDLVTGTFLRDCYKAGCHNQRLTHISPVSANILQNRMAIVVNDLDWLMDNKSSFIFTVPFSLAPRALKDSWKGLLFSKDSQDKDVVLCLMIKGFESLDWKVIHKSLRFGIIESKLNDLEFSVDISAMLIAFESIFGYDVEDTKLDKKLIFINELAALVHEFSSFYYTGKCLTEDFEVKEIIEKLEETLNPVIESAIYHCDSQYHEDLTPQISSVNLLSQIAFLRHHLKEDNINSNNITIDDFCHFLFEHFFVLTELVKECLHGLRKLVKSSPEIMDIVLKEIKTEKKIRDSQPLIITEYDLEASERLVYTKSTTQELIRLMSLGSQFDLSLAERDGQLEEEYDMKEYSVIVFNHFAFTRSKCFGTVDLEDAECFRPGRFVKHDPVLKKYVFYNTSQLVTFQDQYHFVAIPRNYLCRLMLLLLIKFNFTDFEIEMDFDDESGKKRLQYELLYDINTNFRWNQDDLV